jgi:hypothetical protein
VLAENGGNPADKSAARQLTRNGVGDFVQARAARAKRERGVEHFEHPTFNIQRPTSKFKPP